MALTKLNGFIGKADMDILVDGIPVRIVQSHTRTASQEIKHIEGYGQEEAYGSLVRKQPTKIKLEAVVVLDDAKRQKYGVDFADLKDFTLAIKKKFWYEVYEGCNWTSHEQSGRLEDNLAESIEIETPYPHKTVNV
jgi:hypothetical protein